MYTKVSDLSDFVLGLHMQAQDKGMVTLLPWAVAHLADILGYDCAWYGWAQLEPQAPVIHANSTYNLPRGFYDIWTGMCTEDVLVDQYLDDPTSVPVYDRTGNVQTEGMTYLADTFAISKMATAMSLRRDRTASFFLSAYRSGPQAKPWTKPEQEFLQCAVDQISAAARMAAHGQELSAPDGHSTSLILSHHGATILGLGQVRERFGHLWSAHDGDRVPRWLADYVNQPGEHLLLDQELVARFEPVSADDGLAWHKLSLRPMRKFDLLTEREREVARTLAEGHSHKVAARLLGVAPSTIRNQTQAIYRKLEIDNRASLAAKVPPGS